MPIEQGNVLQGIDDNGRAKKMECGFVPRVRSGGGECGGGKERANEEQVDAHQVRCLGEGLRQ